MISTLLFAGLLPRNALCIKSLVCIGINAGKLKFRFINFKITKLHLLCKQMLLLVPQRNAVLVSGAVQSVKCGCSTELLDVSCQQSLFVPLCPPLILLSPAQLPIKPLEERLLCCWAAWRVRIHQWREWQSAFPCWNKQWVLPGGTVLLHWFPAHGHRSSKELWSGIYIQGKQILQGILDSICTFPPLN